MNRFKAILEQPDIAPTPQDQLLKVGMDGIAEPNPADKAADDFMDRVGKRMGKAWDRAVGEKIGLDDYQGVRESAWTGPEFAKPFTTPVVNAIGAGFDLGEGVIRSGIAAGAETAGSILGLSGGDKSRLERDLNLGTDMAGVAMGANPSVLNKGIRQAAVQTNPIESPAPLTDRERLRSLLEGSAKDDAALPEDVRPTGFRGKLYDLADKLENNAVAKKLRVLGDVPQERDYLALRGRTVGRIAEADTIGENIQSAMQGFDDVTQQQVYRYLTTQSPSTMIKDVAAREKAIEIKGMIDDVGKKLVDNGRLTQEVFETGRHTYLPRIYLDNVLKGDIRMGGAVSKSDESYLKARDNTLTETQRREMGEIKDPGFLGATAAAKPTRDIAVDDFLETVAQNPEWVNPASVADYRGAKYSTAGLREQASLNREKATRMNNSDPEMAQKLIRDAEEMEQAIETAENLSQPPVDISGYKKIPDRPQYGKLRGMEVRKGIHDDITHLYGGDEDGLLHGLFYPKRDGVIGKGHRAWKMSKTVLNPPTHFRNMMSNSILLNVVGGVPLRQVPKYLKRSVSDIRSGEGAYKVAKDYGLIDSTFTTQELMRFNEYDFLQPDKGMPSLVERAAGVAGKGINKMADVYQLEEVLFKVARVRYGLDKGETPAEAAMNAQDALFDYSLAPNAVAGARSNPIVGSPFITFRYKAAGALADSMVRHPERFLPYVALPYAMLEMWQQNNDFTDEEVDHILEVQPEWQKEKGTVYGLPIKDEDGRIQFIDVGYIFPWGDLMNMGSGLASGDMSTMFKDTGIFGAPVSQIAMALATNEDTFTGKDIVNTADPKMDQLKSALKWSWDMAAPTILNSRGGPARMYDSSVNETDRWGEPNITMEQAALRNLGINIYPMNPELSHELSVRRIKGEISEIKRRRNYLRKDQQLTDSDRDEINEKYNELMREKQDELQHLQGLKEKADKSRRVR